MTKRLLIFLAIVFALLACGPLVGISHQEPPHARTLAPHASAGVTPQMAETPASGNIVNVTESEFSVTFQPAQPSAGEITFVVKNQGHVPHDFHVHGNGVDQRTSLIMPQQSVKLTLQLKPGTYAYECAIEGHAVAGMHGTLTIKASSSN